MKSYVFNQQRVIQTTGHIFWVMQFTRDIPENDEQYLPRVTSRESTGKLYGQFCNIGKNHERTGRKNGQVFKDSRETQFVFQEVKI